MVINIRHTGLVVFDLEASLRFYRDLLGFKVQKQALESGDCIDNMLGLKNVKVTTVKMTAPDGQMLELLHFESHKREPRKNRETCEIGITHFAVTVDNLDQTYKKLTQAGIKFNAPPQLSADGNVKVTYCQDPNGSFVELVEVLNKS